jgi:hypothetical protein
MSEKSKKERKKQEQRKYPSILGFYSAGHKEEELRDRRLEIGGAAKGQLLP